MDDGLARVKILIVSSMEKGFESSIWDVVLLLVMFLVRKRDCELVNDPREIGPSLACIEPWVSRWLGGGDDCECMGTG